MRFSENDIIRLDRASPVLVLTFISGPFFGFYFFSGGRVEEVKKPQKWKIEKRENSKKGK